MFRRQIQGNPGGTPSIFILLCTFTFFVFISNLILSFDVGSLQGPEAQNLWKAI